MSDRERERELVFWVCEVLTNPDYKKEEEAGKVMDVRKIVVVVEDVEAARTALQWALHNFIRYGDLITLLHVFPTPRSKSKKKSRLLRLTGFQLALTFKDICSSGFPNVSWLCALKKVYLFFLSLSLFMVFKFTKCCINDEILMQILVGLCCRQRLRSLLQKVIKKGRRL